MRKYLPLTDAERMELAALYTAGHTLPALSKHPLAHGRSHALVRKELMGLVVFRDRGRPPAKEGEGICSLTAEEADRAEKMYTVDKLSLARVAEALATHPPVVRRVLLERGVTMRKVHLGGVRRWDAAIMMVNHAIREGDLTRGPCEECGVSGFAENGRPAVIAHHDDYNLPLVVRWLCPQHHRAWHQVNMAVMVGEGPNADMGAPSFGEFLAMYDMDLTGVDPDDLTAAREDCGENT